MSKRKYTPKLELSFWRKERDLYYADKDKLLEQMRKVNRTNEELNRRMGYGYYRLIDALEGKGLKLEAAIHVESGVKEDVRVEHKGHDWNELVREFPGVELNDWEKGPF